MQKLDTRVKNKNLHGGDETNHGELKPATILEIKNQNQGCRESINGEEAKETKNKSRHLANEVIENTRNLSMSMEEEHVTDRKSLVSRIPINLLLIGSSQNRFDPQCRWGS